MPARFRILALDVDGTLLDSSGTLRPSTAESVARAARAGIQPVLCTGRRYRRALPVARELGLATPLVCNSGAVVKHPEDDRTLWRADLDPESLAGVVAIFREAGHPFLSMIDHGAEGPDFRVESAKTGRVLFDEYVDRNRPYVAVEPDWHEELTRSPHFHVFAIGPREEMIGLEERVHNALPETVRTFVQRSPSYTGTMCEVLHPEASKWAGLVHLAELWGIGPDEICAVGDDMNDVPMLEGAGLGVAMGHAPEAVRRIAGHITEDHDGDGVARFIEEVLLS